MTPASGLDWSWTGPSTTWGDGGCLELLDERHPTRMTTVLNLDRVTSAAGFVRLLGGRHPTQAGSLAGLAARSTKTTGSILICALPSIRLVNLSEYRLGDRLQPLWLSSSCRHASPPNPGLTSPALHPLLVTRLLASKRSFSFLGVARATWAAGDFQRRPRRPPATPHPGTPATLLGTPLLRHRQIAAPPPSTKSARGDHTDTHTHTHTHDWGITHTLIHSYGRGMDGAAWITLSATLAHRQPSR